MLAEVVVPVPPTRSGQAYVKFPHPASRFAVAACAAVLSPESVRVGITGASPVPYRARGVEDSLAGRPRTPEAISEAAARAAEDVDLLGDIYASSAYRTHLARVCTCRALETATARSRV